MHLIQPVVSEVWQWVSHCAKNHRQLDDWGTGKAQGKVPSAGVGQYMIRQSKQASKQSRWLTALELHYGVCPWLFICWSYSSMSKWFYQSLITHAYNVNTIRKHHCAFKDKNLRLVDSVICPLFSSLLKPVPKKCLYVYSALCKPKYVKNHKYMKYSAEDELVFKLILCFTKGLCKYSSNANLLY